MMKHPNVRASRFYGPRGSLSRLVAAFRPISFRHVVLTGVLVLLMLSSISSLRRPVQSAFESQRLRNRRATIDAKQGLVMDALSLRNENVLWPLQDEHLSTLRRQLRTVRPRTSEGSSRHIHDDDTMDGTGDAEFGATHRRPIVGGDEEESRESDASDVKHRALTALSIFVSIVSYRDALCPFTIRSLFSQALNPGTIFVGLVEQHDVSLGDSLCVADPASVSVSVLRSPPQRSPMTWDMPTNKDEPGAANDPDGIHVELVHAHLKVMRVPPRLSKGPAFARYLAAQMYGGENYFLMIDSHMTFRLHWDRVVIKMYMQVDMEQEISGEGSLNGPVISHHPPPWVRNGNPAIPVDPEAIALLSDTTTEGTKAAVDRDGITDTDNRTVNYVCLASFERPEFGFPILHSTIQFSTTLQDLLPASVERQRRRHHDAAASGPMRASAPRPFIQPFVGAGFLFASSALLREAPFDPHLEYLFHGEEILLSARLWTSGFDFYAPNEDIAWHYYYRREAPKYYNDPQVRGGATDIESESDERHSAYLRSIQRVQYLLQIPKYVPPWERVTATPGDMVVPERLVRDDDPSIDFRVKADAEWYGMGTERSLRAFWANGGVDIVNRKQDRQLWCCYPTSWRCVAQER